MRERCPPRAHGPLELRRRDSRTARWQCLACLAAVGKPFELNEVEPRARQALKPWATSVRAWAAATRARRRPSGNSRARRYRAFLRSAAWRAQRLRVLERDGWRCQGHNCGADLRPPARATVHHRRYADVLEDTPDSELAASCNRCNLHESEARHGRDRSAERRDRP